MSRLITRHEKHVYIIGEVSTLSSSTPFKPLQAMFLKGARVTLGTAPSGNGSTVVNLIRNGDTNDVLYSATFDVGDTTVNINTEASLAAGDEMSLNVAQVADTSGGLDLIFSLKYHN
jgi:hypothetical protein